MRLSRLLIATHNAGKVCEIREALHGLVEVVLSQAEIPGAPAPAEELGETYAENALLKARSLHEATGLPVLADDSGLEVDALGGRPGLHSSRYGESDAERVDRLLREMEGADQRHARFVCVMVLLLPSGSEQLFEGKCEGSILRTPRGAGGFGFDPVFHVPGLGCSMAELTLEQKNRISHRARALAALAAWLAGNGP